MRLLALDIGNTQIKIGLFDDEKLRYLWKLTTGTKRTTDEYGAAIWGMLQTRSIDPSTIERVAISSVVPAIMHSVVESIRRYLKIEPLVIGPGTKSGVKIRTANPREVGADLICDVAACLEYYSAPCIIVDFGTVTKYEIIDQDGVLMAAVFSPGIGISAEAMSEKAAQLPPIEIRKPESIITSVTMECMQAGLVYGYIGQVQYIVEQIKKEMNLPDMKVIATGGFGKMLAGEIPAIDHYDNELALKGVRLIAMKNKSPKKLGS
ncbi:MAG: type III pantothenate kinase [Firmicutes bacterium]|nr:type III pantothenate kinase [Bacillota bacterium]